MLSRVLLLALSSWVAALSAFLAAFSLFTTILTSPQPIRNEEQAMLATLADQLGLGKVLATPKEVVWR